MNYTKLLIIDLDRQIKNAVSGSKDAQNNIFIHLFLYTFSFYYNQIDEEIYLAFNSVLSSIFSCNKNYEYVAV